MPPITLSQICAYHRFYETPFAFFHIPNHILILLSKTVKHFSGLPKTINFLLCIQFEFKTNKWTDIEVYVVAHVLMVIISMYNLKESELRLYNRLM